MIETQKLATSFDCGTSPTTYTIQRVQTDDGLTAVLPALSARGTSVIGAASTSFSTRASSASTTSVDVDPGSSSVTLNSSTDRSLRTALSSSSSSITAPSTPSPPGQDSPVSAPKLSAEAIAGVVAGCVIVAVLIIALGYFFIRRRKAATAPRKEADSQTTIAHHPPAPAETTAPPISQPGPAPGPAPISDASVDATANDPPPLYEHGRNHPPRHARRRSVKTLQPSWNATQRGQTADPSIATATQ